MPIVAAFDFFHTYFDLFFCKDHVVSIVFNFNVYQVDFYVADSGTGTRLNNGQDVVDYHRTVRVGSINVEFIEVFLDLSASIHGE